MSKLLLQWDGGEEEFDWDILVQSLTDIMHSKNKGITWEAKVENFGWRGIDGEKVFVARNGQELLQSILPDTDCHFKIYHNGKNGIKIQNFHHDSPTGREWYYIKAVKDE